MIRIILVVDDPNSAQDIQNRLQRMCYDVVTATADEVLTRADKLRPDVILMDVRLTGGADGIEVAQQIKSLDDIPIIFIAANADEATVRRAIAAEPDGFLIKPLDELELLAAIDVATRKYRKERQARVADSRLREITDALPVVVYETDATGRMTFANATAFDMFGYTKEEFEAGMPIFQLIAPADKERARAVFHRRMDGEDAGRMEYTGLRKDGSTFPVSALGAPIRRDGAVVGVRGIAVDNTERKRAEEGVKERTHTIEALNRIMAEGNRATHVQSFAKTVTDLTLELLHFDVGTIHLHDYNALRANLCYATGIPDIAVEAIRNIPLDDAAYARVLVEGKPLFVDGHEALRVPHAAELGLKSLAVVPLYRYDTRIGALNVGSFTRHTFSQAEKELLIAIGNEVGVVIAKLQADELIRITLKEKETLLKEIHHRVKNNMQVISSLISLQAQQATEPETVEMLKESQSRIRSMALIHEKLYRSDSLAEISFRDYVDSMVDELLGMFNVAPGAITITTDVENVLFGVDTAIPCALIINELVSNSLKHAFPDGAPGEVTIALHQINGTCELTVADNGVGPPPNFDFRATDSLGMQLVTALINQLDGTITLDRTKGTTFIITFTQAGRV
ncbi:MAG: histidine kinase dimerization/phosphoacceptor domain -containing protein [Halobacteriota archaeon]